jgi:hypothetical protein
VRKVDPERLRARRDALTELGWALNDARSVDVKCEELHSAMAEHFQGHGAGSRLQTSASSAWQSARSLVEALRAAAAAAGRMDVTIEIPDPEPADASYRRSTW